MRGTMARSKRSRKHLVWIDCEMTGLDPGKNVLLEIATIITDYDLNIVARGPVLAIRQGETRLKAMDAWNRRTHAESGLLARVRAEGVSVAEAERLTLAFVKRYCYARTAPLCGNSIGQDKRFLVKYMPTLHDFLHYKIVDVSSIKVLVSEWYEGKIAPPEKQELHRALADIEESIEELKFYRKKVFVRPRRG
jgi:oligoribonuclease